MSVQTQNTNLNPYSGTPIKNLEYIQNKALVIAPFEITKSGLLDTDLMLDTPGFITMNLYKKIVAGEDKEPTADQFKTIKTMSDLDSSNLISTFNIPVIFKYDKETCTRTIEKDLTQVPNNLDYIDFTIDVSNTDLSSETGSGGFFCVCQVQKIQKPTTTTAFTEVANDEFLFMIPSDECREIPELVEFDLLDSDNKVINIKRFGEPGEGVYTGDIYKDKVSLLLDGNDLTDKTGKTITNTGVTVDTSVKKYGNGSLKFNGSSYLTLPTSTDLTFGTEDFTIEMWFNIIQLIGVHQSIYCTCTNGLTPNALNITCGTDGRTLGLGIGYGSGASSLLNSNTKHDMNTWNHMVVIRTGGIIRLFLNGKNVGQVANTSSIVSDIPIVGVMYGTRYFKGYIDDFRITKGIARYTDNFTPPNELSYYLININEQEQGYRIYPVIKIPETTTTPKYYLGFKYQRNIMDVLSQSIKTKRTIYNLKDMYLVDDVCLATLNKINQQLELDSMIKLTERLCNAGIVEKINAEYLLEFITSSVANSNDYTCNQIIVDSLIGDYLFTQEEIDNLNINLNTFKNRVRLTIPSVTITGDQFKFKLPTSFVDSNRSGSLKTNLVIFGTDKGFDKYNLISGTIPMYSDITKLETPRVLNDLISTVPTLAGLIKGNIESYLTTNLPRIFTRTTDIGVTDISSNVQKAPGLLSDVDANGIRGIYSTANYASYSAANNFNFYTGDFTIEFDLKSVISQVNPFFVIGEQGSACHLAVYFQSNNSLIFRAGINDWGWDFSSERSTPAGSILPGVYYHVVFQRTNGVLDIYIDGVKIHTSAWAYNIRATGYIWFGSYFGGSGYTNYRFNNFEVYKRAKYTGNFNSKTRYGSSDKFKSILTDYKQRLPFTYIPLSTNMDDVGSKPVFENLTDITGFNHSEIVIDIPNVL